MSVFVIVPVVGLSVFNYLENEGYFKLNKIQVLVDNKKVQSSSYLAPLVAEVDSRLEKYRGVSLSRVDMKFLHNEFVQLKWIQSLQISREWPSTLNVLVTPKTVRFIYMNKKRELLPVGSDGEFMDPVLAKDAPDVALIEGEIFARRADLRKKAVQLMDEIPSKGTFSQSQVSDVHYENKNGFFVNLIKDEIQIKMGEDFFASKAARVNQVLDYLQLYKFEARVIDANLSQKVLVRLRKDP
jgi:cell division protein FtsQ